jgi:hypothetical protein
MRPQRRIGPPNVTMLVVASRGSVPSRVFAHALDPPDEALDGLGMVARHISEIGAGHRFRRTTAAGACSTGVYGGCEKYCGKYLQQGSLVVCDDPLGPAITKLLLGKSNCSMVSRFQSMTITAALTITRPKVCRSWAERPAGRSADPWGRYPNDPGWKSASKIGSQAR